MSTRKMAQGFKQVTNVSTSGEYRNVDAERRQSLRLVYYWDKLRGDRTMPVEDDIDPDHEAIRDIWDHCFIVQMRDLINKEFNYTYLGPAIVDAYQGTLCGTEHGELVSLNASKLLDAYQEVIDTARPVLYSGECNDAGGGNVKFRQCLLPLGRQQVEVIFGHMTYGVY